MTGTDYLTATIQRTLWSVVGVERLGFPEVQKKKIYYVTVKMVLSI